MSDWPAWRFLAQIVAFRPVFWGANIVSIIVLSVLETGPGLVARSFFDWLAAGAAPWQTLWWLLALLVGLALGRVAFLVSCQATNMPLMLHGAALLQRNMLARTLELPGAAGLPHSSGEAISRFRDDVDDTTVLPIGFNDMVAWAAFAAVGFVIMLSISPLITLAVVVPLLVLVSVVNAARTRIETYRRAVRAATGEVTAFLAEVFAATATITAAAAEERTVQRFRELNRVRLDATVRDRVFDQMLQSTSRNVANLGSGVILLLVAGSISAETFSVGDFALFVFYLGWVGEFTNQFGVVMALYRRSAVSFRRMAELLGGAHPSRLVQHRLEQPPPVVSPVGRLDMLRIEGLTYVYPESGRGVRDVSLSIGRGECVVITGRVAAGKTTLLRALTGLLPRSAGAIYWNGELVTDPAAFFAPPRCAYTPQVPRLFSDTLRGNILLGRLAHDVDVERAVGVAQLTPDISELLDGLETPIGPRGVSLSGGQVQRTAIARMLVRSPELLVIDDLSTLDATTESRLWEQLLALGSTIVAASHRRAALQAATRIVVLIDGGVAAIGGLAELLERSQEMQQLWYRATDASVAS